MLVSSLGGTEHFSEQCNTTLVNAHGCGLIVPRAITQGIQVRLEIVSAKRHTTARVAEVVPLGGEPETWLVGLELDIPGNFWGIDYAPSDWKIAEMLPPPVRQPAAPETHTPAKPAHAPRWRLTDISGGACYLETTGPFPTGTPVLLSIRSLDTECLLDGVVRVTHPKMGMGVEFTATAGEKPRPKVERLIQTLTVNREVPKIFVGRKEDKRSQKEKQGSSAPSEPGSEISPRDPLLELVLSGSTLTVEQFLSDLKAQRLGDRRDPRIDLALPVSLTGIDASGRPLDQRVMTINISRRGALLEGVHGVLKAGDTVSLGRLQKKEQFRVAWVTDEASPANGQIGVAAVDPNTSFWNEVLEATAESGLEMASLRSNDAETKGGARH